MGSVKCLSLISRRHQLAMEITPKGESPQCCSEKKWQGWKGVSLNWMLWISVICWFQHSFLPQFLNLRESWVSSLISLLNLSVTGLETSERTNTWRYNLFWNSPRAVPGTRTEKETPFPLLRRRQDDRKLKVLIALGCHVLNLSVAHGRRRGVGRGQGSAVKMVEECSNTELDLCGWLLTSGKQGWCFKVCRLKKYQISTECYFYPRPWSATVAPDAASGEVIHPASTCRSLCSLSELYLGMSIYSHWIYICCLQSLKRLIIAEISPCFSGLRSAPLPHHRELRELTVLLTSCTLRLQLYPGDLLISVCPQKLSGDWRIGGAQSCLQWVKMEQKILLIWCAGSS